MRAIPAYDELVDFIASGTTPTSVIAFHPSESTMARVEYLIHLEKTEGLGEDERTELDHYMQLEHLMRLAKARARRYLTDGSKQRKA